MTQPLFMNVHASIYKYKLVPKIATDYLQIYLESVLSKVLIANIFRSKPLNDDTIYSLYHQFYLDTHLK
jgi:hypothetical protein